jgi:hypothetical protein
VKFSSALKRNLFSFFMRCEKSIFFKRRDFKTEILSFSAISFTLLLQLTITLVLLFDDNFLLLCDDYAMNFDLMILSQSCFNLKVMLKIILKGFVDASIDRDRKRNVPFWSRDFCSYVENELEHLTSLGAIHERLKVGLKS